MLIIFSFEWFLLNLQKQKIQKKNAKALPDAADHVEKLEGPKMDKRLDRYNRL